MKDVNSFTRKKLLDLPHKNWDSTKIYESILLVPTRKKHDSGWHIICIVGCNKQKPVEIAGYCDDISWIISRDKGFDEEKFLYSHQGLAVAQMRTDMTYPGGCTHIWGRTECFEVGMTTSSTDIKIKRKK